MAGPEELARLKLDYPRWELWEFSGRVRGWRRNSHPPVVLRSTTAANLRAQIIEFERVWDESKSALDAIEAAEAIENGT